MGYYSEVKVSTTKEGFEFFKLMCDKPELEGHELFGGYGYVEYANDEKGVVFGWEYVKWYHKFPDVRAFLAAMDAADEAGIPYEYIEVGEDGQSDERSNWNATERLRYHIEVYHTIEIYGS